jgi:DNA-binding LacI/PurR family transcriptional regulator
MAVTILQIAERVNLSHSTVSRVLNNKTDTYIAEETRRRVQTVAREMGYRPNLAARSLRDSRTNMVGIFASPYVGIWSGIGPDIVRGISNVLHRRHLDLFFAFAAEEEDPGAVASGGLPAWRYDGAIILQRPTQRTLEHLNASGQPFVAVNEILHDGVSVLSDERQGVDLALRHLWGLGHRRIGYANVMDWHMAHYSIVARHDAYLGWMRQHEGVVVAGHDTVLTLDREKIVRWLRQVVEGPNGPGSGATAILVYDHAVCIDVLTAAQTLGLRVPEDLSLVCFNDEFPVARIVPALTVVAPQAREMGQKAAELLVERMDVPGKDRPLTLRIPATLIVRDSTTVPPLAERRV